MEIRQFYDYLIYTIETPTQLKLPLYIKTSPWRYIITLTNTNKYHSSTSVQEQLDSYPAHFQMIILQAGVSLLPISQRHVTDSQTVGPTLALPSVLSGS